MVTVCEQSSSVRSHGWEAPPLAVRAHITRAPGCSRHYSSDLPVVRISYAHCLYSYLLQKTGVPQDFTDFDLLVSNILNNNVL